SPYDARYDGSIKGEVLGVSAEYLDEAECQGDGRNQQKGPIGETLWLERREAPVHRSPLIYFLHHCRTTILMKRNITATLEVSDSFHDLEAKRGRIDDLSTDTIDDATTVETKTLKVDTLSSNTV